MNNLDMDPWCCANVDPEWYQVGWIIPTWMKDFHHGGQSDLDVTPVWDANVDPELYQGVGLGNPHMDERFESDGGSIFFPPPPGVILIVVVVVVNNTHPNNT